MGWGGIIAGALGGGAEAIEDVSKKQIEVDNKEHMAKFAADLELDKLRQADQMARDTALWNTSGAGGDAKRAAEVKSAQGLAIGAAADDVLTANAKVAERAAESARKAYELQTPGAVSRAVLESQARVQAETAEILKRGGDPTFVKAQHAIAMANHVESAGSLATAALAKLQMTDVTQGQKLHADLAAARKSGDETAITVAQQAITDKAFSGKDTGAAYKAYQSASIAIIGAQEKLNDPTKMYDAATKQSIQADIDDAKRMQQQAMKDLGVKVPDKAAAPAAPVNLNQFDKSGKSGKSVAPTAPGVVASAMGVGSLITQENFTEDSKTMDPLSLFSKYKDLSGSLRPDQRAIVEQKRAQLNSRD